MRTGTTTLIGANVLTLALVGGMANLHRQSDTPEYRAVMAWAGLGAAPRLAVRADAPAPRRIAPPPPSARAAPAGAAPAGAVSAGAVSVEPIALADPAAADKARALNAAAAPPAVAALQTTMGADALAGKLAPAEPASTAGATAVVVEAVVADVSAAIPDRTSAAEDAAARRRELVAEVQTALVLLRYDPGPIDGAMGPRTRAAIRAFEEDLGWYRTGEIDYDVMRALGISGFTTDTLPRDWFDPLPSDRPAATAAMPGTAPPPEFSEQPADGPPVAPTALGG